MTDPIPAANTVLSAKGLSFSYPGRHVFTQWSAQFAPGLTWLRGGNGSGKSTLLKLLAGALAPLTGQLEVDGMCAARDALAYRRQVFWCGPGGIAFDHLSGAEFFAFMRSLYPKVNDAELARHVGGFALRGQLQAPLRSLSTGTQRKVWLAVAMAASTRVLLLDEPLNALDSASLTYLQAELHKAALQTQQCWVVASHLSPLPTTSSPRLAPLPELNLDGPFAPGVTE